MIERVLVWGLLKSGPREPPRENMRPQKKLWLLPPDAYRFKKQSVAS